MDIGGVVLHKILTEKSLDAWSRVKLVYFNPAYSSIFSSIFKYYSKYNEIPSFEELEIYVRDSNVRISLASLKQLEIPDIDIDIAIDALVDSYTQNEALKLLDRFLDKVTLMDSLEIKDNLSNIVLKLDEKTLTSTSIHNANSLNIFEEVEEYSHTRFPLGINNTFDASTAGICRQEVMLIGGKRGKGKSIVCANIFNNQIEQGNTCAYFTIEMTAKETFQRIMGIAGEINAVSIKQNKLSFEEMQRLAKVRVQQFEDSEEVYLEFLKHKNPILFEQELNKLPLKNKNRMIIVDDRQLSTTSIDLHLQKLKSQFEDNLSLVIIDYINQVTIPGNTDIYDWKTQIELSKFLKNMARKYDIAIVSPIQIDDNNIIRFAKGLLDAPDMAYIMDTHTREDSAITFSCSKMRSGPPIDFTSGIDWDTLKISPLDVVISKKEPTTKKFKKSENSEDARDMPW